MADHDSLTGIRNRRLFEEDLLTQVGRCQRYGEQAALLMIDLDGFKQINDRYGHAAGDAMLKAVAQTLRKRLRTSDQLARLGGDEFGVLLPHIGRAQAEVVAGELTEAIGLVTISVNGEQIVAAGSIGLAFIDEHTEDSERVLADADRAMYAAKAGRRGEVQTPGTV